MPDYQCEECGTPWPSLAAAERCGDECRAADHEAMLARHREDHHHG